MVFTKCIGVADTCKLKSNLSKLHRRSTNQVYKKIKGFLAEFLSEIAPASDDDSCLAKLLQVGAYNFIENSNAVKASSLLQTFTTPSFSFEKELWNSFQENPENWIDLSSLEFDVDDQVIMQVGLTFFV